MASKVDNIEVDEKDGSVTVSVNPKLYPLEVVYSAAYALLEKAYVHLDGDPAREIIVKLRPSIEGSIDLLHLAREFNNELINYTVYAIQSERNRAMREAVVQRAFFTSTGPGTHGEHVHTDSAKSSVSPAVAPIDSITTAPTSTTPISRPTKAKGAGAQANKGAKA